MLLLSGRQVRLQDVTRLLTGWKPMKTGTISYMMMHHLTNVSLVGGVSPAYCSRQSKVPALVELTVERLTEMDSNEKH